MPVNFIRENCLYLYISDEFSRIYEEQEELKKDLSSIEPGMSWVLYDNAMNIIDSGVA